MDASSTPTLRRLFSVGLGAIVAFAGACTPSEPALARPFTLTQVRPESEKRVGVLLNEVLHFHFSDDIDPTSVTRESLVIRPCVAEEERDEPGWVPPESAAGIFEIEGDRVRFLPHLPEASNLLDGGFQPGTWYEVILRGFPLPDGLRSADGRILRCSYSFLLETTRDQRLFVDETGDLERLKPSSKRPSPWEPDGDGLAGKEIPREGAIYLLCAKPLDPRTVKQGEFRVVSSEHRGESTVLLTRLIENTRERGAVLELTPQGILEPGSYTMPRDLSISLRDFGGNRVWYPPAPGEELEFVVAGGRIVRRDMLETFLDTVRLSSLPVPDADGTACWRGDGVVTISFPRAAGDGSDGECVLSGPFGEKDLQASRLTVESGSATELLSAPGIVVLRAQGLLRIEGRLSRRCGDGEALDFVPGETLSRWLARAIAEDRTVTVLIAGGDLLIEGAVRVDGPLLLVAGGRIRVICRDDEIEAQAGQLWQVGAGGGQALDGRASRPDLVLDPPHRNPLVETLTYYALSDPIPSENRPRYWTRALVGLSDNNGRATVRFVDPNDPVSAPMEEWRIVDDPSRLPVPGPLCLLLQLEVDPPDPDGPRGVESMFWNPPVIDEVRLYWAGSNPEDL